MPTTPGRLRARYELTAKDLAEATGAHMRTVRKWEAAEDVAIQERFTTGLEALETVLEEIQDFSLPFVHTWLRQPKQSLDGLSPREALGQGRWEEVLHQARLTSAGAPPLRHPEPPPAGVGREDESDVSTP
jgi:transcriptional regulator with XRE-family HTH domain